MPLWEAGSSAGKDVYVILEPALEAVAAGGMTEQARNSAAGALMALRKDDQPARHDSELPQGERHVMLSYNWAHQEVMKRVNTSLLGRGYSTWFE